MSYYIKKFIIDNKEHTIDIIKVNRAIKNKKDERVIFSKDKESTEEYNGVTEVFEFNGKYIVDTEVGIFEAEGMDDNKRKAERFFLHFFDNSTGAILNLEEARRAVALGHNVRATTDKFRTGKIIRFLDDETFETFSGSIYQVVWEKLNWGNEPVKWLA